MIKKIRPNFRSYIQSAYVVSMQHDIEALDPRGRTPLHLAVTLGRVKCVEALLHHNANSLALNRHHWAGILYSTHTCACSILC